MTFRALFAACLAVATSVEAQSDRAVLLERLDSIAESGVAARQAVGLAVAIVRDNDTLLLKSYGQANVEWDVPMPLDAMFEIGSVTKQFTAAAVLQLRDAGKLSLDDDITKWLPDFDTRGNQVTLRRLLDHTSGIVGMTELPEFAVLSFNPRFPRDSAYALIKRQPFKFATGSAQVYNNSAYWLLGLVIERASGMSYEDYVEHQIFEPLGMTRTMYCSSEENVARRAHGYRIQGSVVLRASMNVHTWPFAAGSICSTAGDLLTWLLALHGGRVVSAQSYAEMTSPAKLADGTPTRYGLGLNIERNYGGQMVIGHGGTIDGFRAAAVWYPEAKLAVVVLLNTLSNLSAEDAATELGAALLPWKQPDFKTFAGDAAELVGTYRGPARGREMVVEVTQTADRGVAFSVNGGSARSLPYVDGLTWQGGIAFLTFRRASNRGRATELLFDGGGGNYFVLVRQ
jgi:CubicO group peptidase (beta-lactamase class C family)